MTDRTTEGNRYCTAALPTTSPQLSAGMKLEFVRLRDLVQLSKPEAPVLSRRVVAVIEVESESVCPVRKLIEVLVWYV